jgi:hypothetical protein
MSKSQAIHTGAAEKPTALPGCEIEISYSFALGAISRIALLSDEA